jgi:hypothetical protein
MSKDPRAYIHAQCKECGAEEEKELAAFGIALVLSNPKVIEAMLKDLGWIWDGDRDLCEGCADQAEKAETTE